MIEMRPKLWLIFVIAPLMVATLLGGTIVLPFARMQLQILSLLFTISTLSLALMVHEITRRFVKVYGIQREANFVIRASMRRGMFDGLFLLNTTLFLAMAVFFVLISPVFWLNYWLFMMIGATIVLSANLANDYVVSKNERQMDRSLSSPS